MSDVLAEGAAIQMEGAAIHICAAAFRRIHSVVLACILMGDFAGAFAVGQGKSDVLANFNRIYVRCSRDGVAVQTQLHVVRRCPCAGKRHILGQVVVAVRRSGFQLSLGFDGRPSDILGMLAVRAGFAANGVLVRCAGVQNDLAALIHGIAALLIARKVLLIASLCVRADNGDGCAVRGSSVCGHADFRAGLQALCANLDGGTTIVQIDIVLLTATVISIVSDLRIARHGKVLSAHKHTAALRSAVVADRAAVHVEGACCIHTAALRSAVAGDTAAIHVEGAAVRRTHAAAAATHRVAGDAAAVHVEGAVLHIHAAAACIGFVGDLADLIAGMAVGQGKGYAVVHGDDVLPVCAGDAVAVQAEHHAVRGLPCFVFGKRHIVGQVVVTGLVDASQFRRRVDCRPALMGMAGQVLIRRQCDLFGRPLQNGDHLLRTGEGGLLVLRQGVVGLIGFGRSKAGALPRLAVHAVQFRRVRQIVDHRLHVGHGLVLLYSRDLPLFFLFRRLIFLLRFRRLVLLLRFRRLVLLLRFRRLIFLLRFPVCRVCRFLHGRGRLCRPLRLLCQRRRGQQRQAQGQRHETAQKTLLHRSPPVRFRLRPN